MTRADGRRTVRRWPAVATATAALIAVVAAPVGAAPSCTVEGGPDDDVIGGTSGPDVICGWGGNDILRGGSGHDRLRGGPHDDILYGRKGQDRLFGGLGRDRYFGGAGRDLLYARHDDRDGKLDGGRGKDTAKADPQDVRSGGKQPTKWESVEVVKPR